MAITERHAWTNDAFEMRVTVSEDGDVDISFHESGKCVFSLDWGTFNDCIDFAAVHGLAMKEPQLIDAANIAELRA